MIKTQKNDTPFDMITTPAKDKDEGSSDGCNDVPDESN